VDPIRTEKFILRPLTIDDATPRYCAWLDDAMASRYIEAAKSAYSIDSLRAYIRARAQRPDVLFLGIFTHGREEHIGNIKYEPINCKLGYAVMGMLIGERAWRGKGVAQEVIRHSAAWLQRACGVREVVLGVARDNVAAIRAYEKAGFRCEATAHIRIDPVAGLSMVLHLEG